MPPPATHLACEPPAACRPSIEAACHASSRGPPAQSRVPPARGPPARSRLPPIQPVTFPLSRRELQTLLFGEIYIHTDGKGLPNTNIRNNEFGRSLEGESVDPRSKIHGRSFRESWIQYLPESSESCSNIVVSGWDPRSQIQGSCEVFPRNLGSSTCQNHPNHFRTLLIRAGIQDPRFLGETPGQSWILDRGSEPDHK